MLLFHWAWSRIASKANKCVINFNIFVLWLDFVIPCVATLLFVSNALLYGFVLPSAAAAVVCFEYFMWRAARSQCEFGRCMSYDAQLKPRRQRNRQQKFYGTESGDCARVFVEQRMRTAQRKCSPRVCACMCVIQFCRSLINSRGCLVREMRWYIYSLIRL